MRKEYSDLPDRQKITHMKQCMVYCTFTLIPIITLIGVLVALTYHYEPILSEMPGTNSTDTSPLIPIPSDMAHMLGMALVIFFMVGIFGLIFLGSALGDFMCDRLNLYTDIQLETAEKRLTKIKKVLADQAKWEDTT